MAKKSRKKHTTSTTLVKKVEAVKEAETTVEKTEQQDVEVVETKDEVVDAKEEKVNIDKEDTETVVEEIETESEEIETESEEAEPAVEITLQETECEEAVEELAEPEEEEVIDGDEAAEEPEFTVEELLEATKEPEEVTAETEEETAEPEETPAEPEETPAEKSVDSLVNDSRDSKVVEETKSNKFSWYDLVWVTIGLVIGILLSYCIFNLTLSSAIKQLAVDVSNESSVVLDDSSIPLSGITTYNDPNKVLDKTDDIEVAKKLMHDYVKCITTGSTYSQVMVGEEQYIYYMYNSKGEVFTQDANGSYTEVFLNGNDVIKFDAVENVLSVGTDIDVASILRNSIEAIGKENVKLYEMDLTGLDVPAGREFRIDLVGEDAVKLIYSSIGDDFATEMVDSIKSTIKDWEPHIIMVYFIGENSADSYCCCLYVIDNAEYTNWFFQGYDTVNDWALSEDWYLYDADSDTDGEQYADLISDLVSDIDEVMLSYANSKGWVEESTEQSESTETVDTTEEVEDTEAVESEDITE